MSVNLNFACFPIQPLIIAAHIDVQSKLPIIVLNKVCVCGLDDGVFRCFQFILEFSFIVEVYTFFSCSNFNHCKEKLIINFMFHGIQHHNHTAMGDLEYNPNKVRIFITSLVQNVT